jgi:hypothetical protein
MGKQKRTKASEAAPERCHCGDGSYCSCGSACDCPDCPCKPERVLTRLLKGASAPHALEELLRRHWHRLNAIHLVTALQARVAASRSVRPVHQRHSERDGEGDTVRETVREELLRRHWHRLNAIHLVTALQARVAASRSVRCHVGHARSTSILESVVRGESMTPAEPWSVAGGGGGGAGPAGEVGAGGSSRPHGPARIGTHAVERVQATAVALRLAAHHAAGTVGSPPPRNSFSR